MPEEVVEHFRDTLGERGQSASEDWDSLYEKYQAEYPELANELQQILGHQLPEGWDADLPEFSADEKGMATRSSSGKVLNAIASHVPWLVGGSADLAPSTNTLLNCDDVGHFSAENYAGRNFHFGIREHGMAAILNGMALSGLRSYGATFFVFSDYLRPSMRLSALMGVPAIYVFTHDSIGVGEDGPTHQPVEQMAAARAIPGLVVLRPGDANEVAQAWRLALEQTDRPTALVLTRQNVPTLDRAKYASAEGVARGAYVLTKEKEALPQVLLLSTGSELSIAVAAQRLLADEGIRARVVSMPSFELFEEQDEAYRDEVLPPEVTARVAVEAGVRQGWDRYLGLGGAFVGMNRFGASAPFDRILQELGITAERVVAEAKKQIKK